MVLFRHRRFCEEVARPLNYADAQAFRWVTVLHAYLPVLAVVILIYVCQPPAAGIFDEPPNPMTQMLKTGTFPTAPSYWDRAYAEVWPVVMVLACFLLFLAAATGVPSYFFHPGSLSVGQQNSAVALSYYGCAPLVLIVLPVFALGMALVFPEIWPIERNAIAGAFLLVVVLLIWLVVLVRVARRTMPHLKGRAALIAFTVPAFWIGLAGLTLVALPSIVLYVLVVVYSLR
jgi:hypothetical protein